MKNQGRFQEQYFQAAVQYHVTARYAALAGFLPVCGNLFHRAIEMYLKGYLCTTLNEAQRRHLKHNLPEIWARFKKEVSGSRLDGFDEIVSALHKFERIRYPEEIVGRGMLALIRFKKSDVEIMESSRREVRYEVVVGELDALAKVIFEESKFNPLFFTKSLNRHALTYLKELNQSNIW